MREQSLNASPVDQSHTRADKWARELETGQHGVMGEREGVTIM